MLKLWGLVALLVLAGCSSESPLDTMAATEPLSPNMREGLAVLRQACPSIDASGDRYDVVVATEDKASLSAQREFDAGHVAVFILKVTQAGEPSDVGHSCAFEVGYTKTPGVIVNKDACIRICDASADPGDGYFVRKI